MLSLISKIGNDLTLPPHFMSEMHFSLWQLYLTDPEALNFDKRKRTYWPKSFSIQRFNPVRENAVVRHCIFQKIQQWRGLESLHLPLDLRIRDDRVSAPPTPSISPLYRPMLK